MTTPNQAAAAIRELLATALKHHREGILTTADAHGRPHATWMGSVTTPDMVDLITLTSLHSHKVANIHANPHVEWMFTLPDRKSMIYFSGKARIIVDEKLKGRYYEAVPEKSRAFFMKHYRAGGEWCVIKTHLSTAVYCANGTYMTVDLAEQRISLNPRAPI
jgi:general stress protein 26